jgi:hypothetical protein
MMLKRFVLELNRARIFEIDKGFWKNVRERFFVESLGGRRRES